LKPIFKKILGITLPLLLGVFLIIYNLNQFSDAQWIEMKSYFSDADYRYIGLSLFLGFLTLVFRAYRWRYTLEYLGYISVFKTNFLAVCVAYLMNMTVPRSGEVTRAVILNKYQRVPFDKAFGTIIAERVVDFCLLLLFITTALILQFEKLKTFLLKLVSWETLLTMGLIAFMLGVCVIMVFIYSKNRWILKVKNKISGFTEGLTSVFKMPGKIPFLFFTVLIWGLYVLMFYVTIFSLDTTSNMPFGVVFTSFIVGGLAITFTNSGFGAYPVLVAEILLIYQIPLAAGTAFGWIVWTSQTLLIVFMGALSALLLPILHKNKN
jgi:glycosyltransferase 2 family protein